jgi:quercetin dioxygenase-like cupin family protein
MRERAEERLDGSAAVLNLPEEFAKLASEIDAAVAGHRQITLFKGYKSTVAIFDFERGGGMREHSAPGVVTVHVLQGELEIDVAGAAHRVHAQNILVIPPGARHDVKAIEPSQMLLTVSLLTE